MKTPDSYWVLAKAVVKRTDINKLVRPGLLHTLYGLPDPHPDYKYPEQSLNERYWGGWLEDFNEIDASVQRLHQAYVYLTHYPGAKAFPFQRLSEAEWITYHVEVHVQELYILDQRLGRFLRRVEKIVRTAKDDSGSRVVQHFRQAVRDGLSRAVRVRSLHVHESRLRDNELRDLEFASTLSRARAKLPMLRVVRGGRHADALRKWKQYMRESNKNVLSACVTLFGEITKILEKHEPPDGWATKR